jgi:hypothetical protein
MIPSINEDARAAFSFAGDNANQAQHVIVATSSLIAAPMTAMLCKDSVTGHKVSFSLDSRVGFDNEVV